MNSHFLKFWYSARTIIFFVNFKIFLVKVVFELNFIFIQVDILEIERFKLVILHYDSAVLLLKVWLHRKGIFVALKKNFVEISVNIGFDL